MADRPILFSASMVQALLAGRKTQTRRIIKDQSNFRDTPQQTRDILGETGEVWTGFLGWQFISTALANPGICGKGCLPRIFPGDRLWVREAWRSQDHFDGQSPSEICAEFETEYGAPSCPAFYEADKQCDGHSVELWQQSQPGRLRASMHMPRCASRLTLLVSDVRVERLQDISRDDAIAEGLIKIPYAPVSAVEHGCDWGFDGKRGYGSPVSAYAMLWDHINGADAWAENPWIVAVTFDVIKQNIDEVAA